MSGDAKQLLLPLVTSLRRSCGGADGLLQDGLCQYTIVPAPKCSHSGILERVSTPEPLLRPYSAVQSFLNASDNPCEDTAGMWLCPDHGTMLACVLLPRRFRPCSITGPVAPCLGGWHL